MDGDSQTAPQRAALAPEDYYLEGSCVVFTAAYHRKRGYCCGSGCRHCPYTDEAESRKERAAGS